MLLDPLDVARADVGEHLVRLRNDPRWLRRRVDSVAFVDADSVVRRTTFDIDTSWIAQSEPDGLVRGPYVAVPLTTMRKQLLVDCDLRDAYGGALHIATSVHDSYLSLCEVVARATAENIAVARRPRVVAELLRIVREFPRSEPGDIRNVAPEWVPTDPAWDYRDDAVWNDLFTSWRMRLVIRRFTFGFTLYTYLPAVENISIVKLASRSESEFSASQPVAAAIRRLGLGPTTLQISMPGTADSQRNHLHFSVPDGLECTRVRVTRGVSSLKAAHQSPITPAPQYQSSLTTDRAHVYVSVDGSNHRHFAEVTVHVAPHGLLRSMVFASAFSALVLLGGILFHDDLVRVGNNVDAAVAILLVAPSLVSAYLARPGEHVLLGRLLRPIRYWLALSSLSVFVAAASAILYLGPQPDLQDEIWRCCFFTAGLAADVVFGAYLFSALWSRNTARNRSTVTRTIGLEFEKAGGASAALAATT